MGWLRRRRSAEGGEPNAEEWPSEKTVKHLPLARTFDEAKVWVGTQTCDCGGQYGTSYFDDVGLATQWRMSAHFAQEKGWMLTSYDCTCLKCSAHQSFGFRVHGDESVRPVDAVVWYGADEPSQLIDAGQWFLLYLEHSDHAGGKRGHAPEEEDRRIALAALAEVRKFVPAGKSRVPSSAFWTDVGKQVHKQFDDLLRVESLDRIRVDEARKA